MNINAINGTVINKSNKLNKSNIFQSFGCKNKTENNNNNTSQNKNSLNDSNISKTLAFCGLANIKNSKYFHDKVLIETKRAMALKAEYEQDAQKIYDFSKKISDGGYKLYDETMEKIENFAVSGFKDTTEKFFKFNNDGTITMFEIKDDKIVRETNFFEDCCESDSDYEFASKYMINYIEDVTGDDNKRYVFDNNGPTTVLNTVYENYLDYDGIITSDRVWQYDGCGDNFIFFAKNFETDGYIDSYSKKYDFKNWADMLGDHYQLNFVGKNVQYDSGYEMQDYRPMSADMYFDIINNNSFSYKEGVSDYDSARKMLRICIDDEKNMHVKYCKNI